MQGTLNIFASFLLTCNSLSISENLAIYDGPSSIRLLQGYKYNSFRSVNSQPHGKYKKNTLSFSVTYIVHFKHKNICNILYLCSYFI